MKFFLNRNMGILLSGQLVSQIGDKFYLLALSFWVLDTTNSPAMMGVVMACSLIPSLILGFVSGAFIDRYNRKAIIVGTDALRGIIVSIVAVCYYFDSLNLPVVLGTQILLSVNAAFFDPTIPTVIPQIVEEKNLARANSMTQFIRGTSSIAGPMLGGIAVAGFGYSFVFIFNAVSFFVSAFFELFLRIPPLENRSEDRNSVKQDIIEGYRYMISTRALMLILLMVGVIHFFVGSIEVIIPVMAKSLGGNGAQNLGYLQALFGSGIVLMALIISFRSIDGKEEKFLFGGVFFIGLVLISISLLSAAGIMSVLPYLPLFLLLGMFVIIAGTSFQTILQKNIPNHMAGRAFGLVSSVGNGSIPMAMLIYGFLLTYISYYNLLIISGLVLLPLSYLCYRKYKGVGNVWQTEN